MALAGEALCQSNVVGPSEKRARSSRWLAGLPDPPRMFVTRFGPGDGPTPATRSVRIRLGLIRVDGLQSAHGRA